MIILYKNERYRVLKESEIVKDGDLYYDIDMKVYCIAKCTISMTIKIAKIKYNFIEYFIRKFKMPYKRVINSLLKK